MFKNLSKLLVAFFLVSIVFSGLAVAKEVTLVVPYPVGGMVDTGARILSPYWEKYLGEKIVVINKSGAGGEIGYSYVAKSKPDGYTIGSYVVPGAQGAQTTRDTAFSNDDFAYIGSQMSDPHVLVVRRDDDRFPNLSSLIDYMKKNNGKTKIGIPNRFDDDDYATIQFMRVFNLKGMKIAAGKEASPGARKQLMGGYTDFHINNSLLWQGYVADDQPLKVLAYLWNKRIESLDPKAPTVEEVTGKKVISATYRGFIAPVGIPTDRLEILRNSFEKAMKDPNCVAEMQKRRIPVEYISGEEFKELVYSSQKTSDDFFSDSK